MVQVALDDLLDGAEGVVAVDRGDVGEELGAIETDPIERGEGERVAETCELRNGFEQTSQIERAASPCSSEIIEQASRGSSRSRGRGEGNACEMVRGPCLDAWVKVTHIVSNPTRLLK